MEKIVKGKITKITNFGAFVAIEGGGNGLIHISEISQSFVRDINTFVHEGEEVEAVVISEDDNGRLSLSLKRLPQKAAPQVITTPPDDYYSTKKTDDNSFEGMMSRFKTISDDKMCDIKKNYDGKRGGGAKRTKH